MPNKTPQEQKDERQIDLVENMPERREAARPIGPGECAVAAQPQRQLAAASDSQSMMRMIETVMSRPDFDIARIEQLLAVKERWDKAEAEKAFIAAKSDLMTETIRVTKDKENKQYDSMYTTLGNLVSTVTPYLSKHGFSHRWDISQGEKIEVTCILSHRLGHSERVTFKVPPDTGGAKNPIQQIKSAITYAKGVTFESVCGLAATDANLDDDGKAAGLDVELADKWLAKVAAAKTETELAKVWEDGAAEIHEANDLRAYDEFKAAVGARKKVLAPAGSAK